MPINWSAIPYLGYVDDMGSVESSQGPANETSIAVRETAAFYRFVFGSTAAVSHPDVLGTNGQGPAGRWVKFGEFAPGTTGNAPLWFETLAAMAAYSAPNAVSFAWCAETDAPYKFTPASATTPNGWTSVASTSGTVGNWDIQSDRISIAPRGGGLDDWPRLFAAIAALATITGSVQLRGGDWSCQTVENFPSFGHLVGAPDVTVISDLAQGDSVNNAPFKTPSPITGLDLGLTNDTTVGATTLTLNAVTNLAVGDWICVVVEDAIFATQYRIVNIVGLVVTVERPILWAFIRTGQPHAAKVYKSNPTQRARIDGHGMTVRGTGGRAIEFIGAVDCTIDDMVLVSETRGAIAGFSGFMASFDNGGLRNRFSHIKIDGNSQATYGIALETNEDSSIEDCPEIKNILTGVGAPNAGVYIYECMNVIARNVHVSKSNFGIQIDYESTATKFYPSEHVVVDACTAHDNAVDGIWIVGGAKGVQVTNCGADRNANYGIHIQNGTIALDPITRDTVVRGCTIKSCTVGGIFVNTNVGQTTIESTSSNANATFGLGVNAGATVTLLALTCRENTNQQILVNGGEIVGSGCDLADGTYGIYMGGAGTCVLSESRIRATQNAVWVGAVFFGTGKLTLVGVRFESTSAANHVLISHTQACVLYLQNCISSGASASGYTAVAGQPSLVWRLDGNDFSSSALPWVVPTPGQANFGQFAVNNAVAVAIPWTAVKATDTMLLTRVVNGGVPGIVPVVAIVAGVGANATGVAGDLSTYDYRFVN